ncbi:MAG: FtsQ-type POTRA domain-containing protein [Candidatus Gracilibacteria bacterium]|nr:FtsQ-type POTRA domain-containing protein [Candidatus Gracilibacteria bacterium]
MFDRKRKNSQYKFIYGKSPVLRGNATSKGFRTPTKTTKKLHPTIVKIKKILILSGIVAVIAFSVYGIFFSKYLTITEVSLKNKELENQNIGDKIKNSISSALGKNIIFTNTKELETKVLLSFPELEKVTLSKKYPNIIQIDFSEYPLVANILNESASIKKSYIINAVGYAVKENYEDKNLPYIKIKSEEPLNIQNAIIEPTNLSYILDAKDYFEEKFGMRIIETIYKPIAREVHLFTEKSFYIWLDIKRPFDQQLKKLKKALVKLNIHEGSLLYIDLRIAGNNGDKIIYKRR